MKKFFREFIFLTIIPSIISFVVFALPLIFFPLPFPIEVLVIVYFVTILLIFFIKKFSFIALVRAFIFGVIIFTALFVDAKIQGDKIIKSVEGKLDRSIMNEAIYTNNINLCNGMQTEWKKVCLNSFKSSYQDCVTEYDIPRFRKDRVTSIMNSKCVSNVLYLTEDIKGCEKYNSSGCQNAFFQKYYQLAVAKEDASICKKITNEAPSEAQRYNKCVEYVEKMEKLEGDIWEEDTAVFCEKKAKEVSLEVNRYNQCIEAVEETKGHEGDLSDFNIWWEEEIEMIYDLYKSGEIDI